MLTKKLIAFVLSFLCLISVISPCLAVNSPAPDAITEQILALQSEYPDGMTWTNTSQEHAYVWIFPGSLYSMSGCAAFAATIQDAVFGSNKEVPVTWQHVTMDVHTSGMPQNSAPYSWDTLFPGDIIVFHGHWVIVVEKFSDHISIAEGNYGGQVKWGRTLTEANVATAKYVFTRYQKSASFIQINMNDAPGWAVSALHWADSMDAIGINPYGKSNKANCTRAEAIYTLWVTHGSPHVSQDCVFTDVPEDAPYRDAVIWAYNYGITAGTSPSTFSPNGTCTRAQGLTLIYRSLSNPDPMNPVPPFDDIASDAYYAAAVAWAHENGITSGTSASTFSPKNELTKSEFITFLYKCFG